MMLHTSNILQVTCHILQSINSILGLQIWPISVFFPNIYHVVQACLTETTDFDVLLTVHLSIFILVINQLDAQNLFYNKFVSCFYMFRAPCAHRQEVKIVLYSIWYHHTYRWPSRAQVVNGTATYRCDDTRVCIIKF